MSIINAIKVYSMDFVPYKEDSTTSKTIMCWFFFIALCVMYLSGVDGALAAGAAPDPSAPLDMLRTARTKAASSNLSVASTTTGAGNVANLILVAMGMIGVGCAAYSGYSLYTNIQQGEQARGSNTTYVIALVIGAMLTLIAIIVGVIANFVSAA